MIHLSPKSVRFVGPADEPGQVRVSINVALPNVPPYPRTTCSHDDFLNFTGPEPEPCVLCADYEAAKIEWVDQVRTMLGLDNQSYYGTLAISGYSLTASKFLALEPDGSEKDTFNAWEVSVAFPNGSVGHVLLPIKYEEPFRALLANKVKPTAKAITKPRVKTAWERLLTEDEK